jgi:iron-sulfur cluster assembly protein
MESVVVEAPIRLTAAAAAELQTLRQRENTPADHYLRIGVKGGGCSGMSYVLEFEPRKPTDQVHAIEGIEVIIDPRHLLYLANTELDYQSGLNARGFVFRNPNAKTTCGCGESFSA